MSLARAARAFRRSRTALSLRFGTHPESSVVFSDPSELGGDDSGLLGELVCLHGRNPDDAHRGTYLVTDGPHAETVVSLTGWGYRFRVTRVPSVAEWLFQVHYLMQGLNPVFLS